jgi:NO-binding membrane sensor protein with MHYT domain
MTEGVTVEWNLNYLFISFAMAFLGSYSAVTLAELYRIVCRIHPKVVGPQVTLFLMAVSIGMGAIWSMHFVGLSAISLAHQQIPLETNLNLFLTFMSLLAPIGCVYFGLFLSSRDQMFTMNKEEFIQLILAEVKSFHSLRDRRILFKLILLRNPLPLILGGSVMGAGVLVMHYIGMMAVSTNNISIHWNFEIVIASILIAIIASIVGYWILFRLLALYPATESLRIGSVCVLTVAVCAVHYIGMAAASYSYDDNNSSNSNTSSPFSSTTTVPKDSVVPFVILISLIYNSLISMIVQAELRSCHYRLSALDRILLSTTQDVTISKHHQSFLQEYDKWRMNYWKPLSETRLENYSGGGIDFLKYLRRNPVIAPVAAPDSLNSPMTCRSQGQSVAWIGRQEQLQPPQPQEHEII